MYSSSGTTGAPKATLIITTLSPTRFVAASMHLDAHDRVCIPCPASCFGMVMGVLGCTAVGAKMVFPDTGFYADLTLRAVEREACTALYGVPTMFVAMLEHPDFSERQLESLRTGIMAGAPCPMDTMRQVITDMHMKEITIAYGMTETSPVSFQSNVDDPIHKRVATVGQVHPHLEVKLVDEAGRIVALGAQGELCTRGYSVMLGYWNDSLRTAEVKDAAGWMHTGDLAVLDERGYCAIVGRLGDMIIRGGEHLSTRDRGVSNDPSAYQRCPGFGVPDPLWRRSLRVGLAETWSIGLGG